MEIEEYEPSIAVGHYVVLRAQFRVRELDLLLHTILYTKITADGIHSVTAMAAVRLKLNFESMLYKKSSFDWTYTIIYCLNHTENNAAIIVACIPLLRSLFPGWKSSGDPQFENSCGSNNESPRNQRDSFIRLGKLVDLRQDNFYALDTAVDNSDDIHIEQIQAPEVCKTASKTARIIRRISV